MLIRRPASLNAQVMRGWRRLYSSDSLTSLTPASTSSSRSLPNSFPKFNLFTDVGQPAVVNLSASLIGAKPKVVTYPFDERSTSQMAAIGKSLMQQQSGAVGDVLPAIILIGPAKPSTACKQAYLQTVRRVARDHWQTLQVVDVSLQQLHEIALWHRKSANPSVEEESQPISEYIANSLLRPPQRIHQIRASGKKRQYVDELDKPGLYKFDVPMTSAMLVSRYLSPIRSIWPWVADSLDAAAPEANVIFLRGLAELVDSPQSCVKEVCAFLTHIAGSTGKRVLLVDGMSSARVQYPVQSMPMSREPTSFERLLARIGASSVQPSSGNNAGQQQQAFQLPFINLQSLQVPMESMSPQTTAAPGAVPAEKEPEPPFATLTIADGIVRAPLLSPTAKSDGSRASRSAACREATELARMLTEDDRRFVARHNYAVLLAQLASKQLEVVAPSTPSSTEVEQLVQAGLHAMRPSQSDIQRIALFCGQRVDLEGLVEAVKSLAVLERVQTEADSRLHGLDLGKLNKHEQRFVSSIITPEMVQTRFDDIGSLKPIKRSLYELITLPLLRPELFSRGIAREAVSGVLLFGPPGTGKTMLAKAVAAESGCNFIAVSLSSVFDMWVGEGEKNVKALFTLARKISPCVIFVDEVDALLETRASPNVRSSRIEVINEFMSEWDGLQSATNGQRGVTVMAATNRPFVLDDAVLRRMPRRLLVDLPDAAGRRQILGILLRDDRMPDAERTIERIAGQTDFYSGSDLKNLALSAAMTSIREGLSANTLTSSTSGVTIEWRHWESALREVPPSLSKETESLKQLRLWNEQFGDRLSDTDNASSTGFFTSRRRDAGIGFRTQ